MEHIIARLLHDFEHGRMTRRQLIQSLALTATAASAAGAVPLAAQSAGGKGFKATTVNHISYSVADYRKTRDFYADLLGMKVTQDNGTNQCYLTFGDTFIIPRNARQGRQAPLVDHFAITVEHFDKKAAKAELERRGLTPREDQESYHVKDPDGFDLQISSTEMKP
jgi:catechol 2,3-dioxygenase-like lactoylglutathione lyase family enzyme